MLFELGDFVQTLVQLRDIPPGTNGHIERVEGDILYFCFDTTPVRKYAMTQHMLSSLRFPLLTKVQHAPALGDHLHGS